MSVELRHLRYFIAVAEEGHITRASERLGMQQPPLSQQIKALEHYLGVQLFYRKARGVELTDAGAAFLDDARRTLAMLERAVETTRRTDRGEQGQLCVGFTPTAPFHPFVQTMIRGFRDTYPMVALTLEEGLTNDILCLQHERLDVALVRHRVVDTQGLTVTPLLEEPMLVALPSTHEFVRVGTSGALLLKDLANELFILYGPPGSGIYDATVVGCDRAGFSPMIRQLAPRVTSALALVAAGMGISLVPESMRCVRLNGVSYRRLKGKVQPKAVLNLVSRRGDPSMVVRHFVDAARAQIGIQ
jgi:DNA-binding transcriptional LysR family regulator